MADVAEPAALLRAAEKIRSWVFATGVPFICTNGCTATVFAGATPVTVNVAVVEVTVTEVDELERIAPVASRNDMPISVDCEVAQYRLRVSVNVGPGVAGTLSARTAGVAAPSAISARYVEPLRSDPYRASTDEDVGVHGSTYPLPNVEVAFSVTDGADAV